MSPYHTLDEQAVKEFLNHLESMDPNEVRHLAATEGFPTAHHNRLARAWLLEKKATK